MDSIRSAQAVAFYLFDVSESADLQAVPDAIGGSTTAARLSPKPATPAYVQYDRPPVSFDGELIGIAPPAGYRSRIRVYDFGVVSVALTSGFSGTWDAFVALGQSLIENAELEAEAERICRRVMERLGRALKGPRREFLSEDYVVFSVTELEPSVTSDVLLSTRGEQIAAMLRGERQPLSAEERARVLDHRLSYLADDLVVATWNAAFVYDTAAGAEATLEILEFANSQLLEYRHYDQFLDAELETIYLQVQRPRRYDQWLGSRYTRAARQVYSLYIDIHELTDRTENTIKFIGDIYAVRLFSLVAERLGLDRWKADVEGKLKTLDDIYRFFVEQSSMSRGNLLEVTIVLILIFELVLIFLGVME